MSRKKRRRERARHEGLGAYVVFKRLADGGHPILTRDGRGERYMPCFSTKAKVRDFLARRAEGDIYATYFSRDGFLRLIGRVHREEGVEHLLFDPDPAGALGTMPIPAYIDLAEGPLAPDTTTLPWPDHTRD
jgi:hypothetical protein